MVQNKLQFNRKAVSDLSEIRNHTPKEWSEQQADKYYSALIDCCRQLLRDTCVLSKSYDRVHESLKGIKCGYHVLFYKKHPSGNVLIVRILHERMDLKHHL